MKKFPVRFMTHLALTKPHSVLAATLTLCLISSQVIAEEPSCGSGNPQEDFLQLVVGSDDPAVFAFQTEDIHLGIAWEGALLPTALADVKGYPIALHVSEVVPELTAEALAELASEGQVESISLQVTSELSFGELAELAQQGDGDADPKDVELTFALRLVGEDEPRFSNPFPGLLTAASSWHLFDCYSQWRIYKVGFGFARDTVCGGSCNVGSCLCEDVDGQDKKLCSGWALCTCS